MFEGFWRFAEPAATAGLQLAGSYDPRLVVLSFAVAAVSSWSMLRALSRFAGTHTIALRAMWWASAALSMGLGIWAMHFTGMVAFMLPVPMEYEFWLTALSILPGTMGAAVAVVVMGTTNPTASKLHIGAVLLASGIGAMHYIGMEAMQFTGVLHYRAWVFVLSLVAAYALAFVALYVQARWSQLARPVLRRFRDAIGALVLGTAVSGMHYGAMAAARFYVATTTEHTASSAPPFLVEGLIIGTVLIVGLIWLGSLVDAHLSGLTDALTTSEAQNRAIVQSMLDAQFLTDASGNIVSVNAAAESIFGYSAAELIGQNVRVLMPEPWCSEHDSYIERYVTTRDARILGKGRIQDLSGQRKNGELFPIQLLVTGFELRGTQFFSGTVRDFSEQALLNAKNELLNMAIDQAADPIIIVDSNRRIEYVNATACANGGYDRAGIIGKTLAEIDWGHLEQAVYDEISAALREERVWSGRLSSVRSDGVVREEEVTISPVKAKGIVTHFVQVRRDVTERAQLQRQLEQAQKLESVGQLAAGIAHEINTPCQYISDNTHFLKDAFADFDSLIGVLKGLLGSGGAVAAEHIEAAFKQADVEYLGEEIPRAIDQSLDGLDRVTRIIRAMKEFSHQGQEKTLADLNHAIMSTVTLATNEWKYVAEVEYDLDPELPKVQCALGEFNQVILNMVVNAAHAIEDFLGEEGDAKGVIRLSTRALAGWVEVRVADTGSGMSEEVRARVFEPFFTTKEVGKGTGQGLSIAYAVIVKKHGGEITVESERGKGSCFVIRLPIEQPMDCTSRAA